MNSHWPNHFLPVFRWRTIQSLKSIWRRDGVRSLATQAPSSADTEATHFGFRNVKRSEKASLVHNVFESVAGSYDVMNDLMSMGLHRVWKDHLVQRLSPVAGMHVIDVAGGTADVAIRIARAAADTRIAVVDVNRDMLRVGQRRCEALGLLASPTRTDDHRISEKRSHRSGQIEFICGDAERLNFPSTHFDAYTISFGMRNVTRPERAIAEAP